MPRVILSPMLTEQCLMIAQNCDMIADTDYGCGYQRLIKRFDMSEESTKLTSL